MKLCADILYWRLKEKLTTVTQRGKGGSALTLNRPEFYLDRSQSFEKNRVYVCSADHLPQSPKLGENVCLICLGQHWNLSAYYDRCSVILVEGNWDIFRVFNLVQEIFNRYDSWEDQLWTILRHGGNLPQMLEASRGIFENPMLLIGSDFRYLGVTEEDYLRNKLGLQLDTQSFDVEKMATFLSLHDMSTHVREPLLLDLQGKRTLSVNIFDQEEYLGCLTAFEKACDDAVLRAAGAARRVPFGVEVALGYLAAKEAEWTAVRTVLSGRMAGVPAEALRERLREQYV